MKVPLTQGLRTEHLKKNWQPYFMNVCRSVGQVPSCPALAAKHNTHWLRLPPPPPILPRPVEKTLWKMCCLAGANDNDNKHASSPEVRNFLTWRALQQSCKVYTALRTIPIPPFLFMTGTPHSWSWRIFPYHSFICPSIHFENVNSCASSLFDYSCFISCTDVCMFKFVCIFPQLSSYPTLEGGFSERLFILAARLVFIFIFVSFFLEYRLINWGRNHYKRYTHSQPLIPAPELKTRGSNTIGLSAGRAEQVDSIEIHTKNLMAPNVCVGWFWYAQFEFFRSRRKYLLIIFRIISHSCFRLLLKKWII